MKKGWEWKRLGEVCEIVNGGTPKTSVAEYWGGKHLWITPAEMGKRESPYADDTERKLTETGLRDSSARMLPPYSVILSSRAPIGHLVINTQPMSTNQGCKSLIPSGQLEHKFLYYYLSSIVGLLDSLGTGATFKELSGGKLKEVEIPLPPLPEQRRIVGVLDEAFAGLARAQANAARNLQNARALFESHLQAVFSQRGKGWVEKRLGEVGKVSMCKRIFKEETTAKGEIPFYKIGTFGKEPDAYIPNQTYNEYRAKYPFPNKGDILISASGTIGRRVRYDGEPAYFQDSNIVWIANDETQVINDYLYHFYGACEWNSTKGATISRLYNDNLRQIVITFPTVLPEQRRIATQLDALSAETQRLAGVYERQLAALGELKQALLHRAFAGEL
ncbi:MAG: restriction endonuclease subunit S [Verrucomicrobiales bacterium]|nr:restriction endonuclease subunit S [Verrucomicrobiales bacterium]